MADMDERSRARPLFWVKPEDPEGEPISRELLDAAEAIFSRVVYLTGQMLNDEARAPQVLEAAVYSVWRRMSNQSPGQPITSPEAYLFRAVVRELADIRAKESRLQYGHSTEDLSRLADRGGDDWVKSLERAIDVEVLLSHADRRTRALYEFWSAGDSWKAVAKHMGIANAENARALFRYGIRRAWERLIRRGRSRRPGPEDETDQ
jgi:hypothetical protein